MLSAGFCHIKAFFTECRHFMKTLTVHAFNGASAAQNP